MESRLVRDGIRCCGEAIDGLPFLMFLVSVTALSKSWSTLLTLIVHELKNRISKPFDFQHLTHTDRHQVAALEQSSGDTLNASYRSVNALLNPSSPKGTRPDGLHSDNRASEKSTAPGGQSPSPRSFASPPQSPERMHGCQQASLQEAAPRPTLRLSRSVESFSQSGVKARNHRHSQSIAAPSRLYSPLPPIEDLPDTLPEPEKELASGRSRSKRESGVWDSFSLDTTPLGDDVPGTNEDPGYFGYALTTPDNIAIQAMTPPLFSPSLEDVAEEPERFVRPRRAPRPPLTTPTSPLSSSFNSYTVLGQKSAYSPKSASCSTLVRRASVRRPSAARHTSNTWRVSEDCWEDDVDYIYEHALEADCDSEWGCALDEPRPSGLERTHRKQNASMDSQLLPSAYHAEFASPVQHCSYDFRASLLMPSAGCTPDLEPSSATSASTSDARLLTPSDVHIDTQISDLEGFILSPSLLIPDEYKDSQDASYVDLLDEYDGGSEHNLTFITTNYSATSSARSSHVRFSRRSSYDSSLMSSVQSSGLWSSPVRRSASSAGSVPELVPSRRSRRDYTSSLIADQLSESMASLDQRDCETEVGEDTTPLGGTLRNRTFFSSEADTYERNDWRNILQTELKTSLELARCGSQRNDRSSIIRDVEAQRESSQKSTQLPAHARPRRHKQAMSDGAAKLLSPEPITQEAQEPKRRSRAATTSQSRSPMLSLFPAPPRNRM
jgi:hypothetical protein